MQTFDQSLFALFKSGRSHPAGRPGGGHQPARLPGGVADRRADPDLLIPALRALTGWGRSDGPPGTLIGRGTGAAAAIGRRDERAGFVVRGRRSPPLPGRRRRARRRARAAPAGRRPGFHDRRPAGRDRGRSSPAGPMRCGPRASGSAPSGCAGATGPWRSPPTGPRPTSRPAASRTWCSPTPSRRTCPAGTSPSTPWPCRCRTCS